MLVLKKRKRINIEAPASFTTRRRLWGRRAGSSARCDPAGTAPDWYSKTAPTNHRPGTKRRPESLTRWLDNTGTSSLMLPMAALEVSAESSSSIRPPGIGWKPPTKTEQRRFHQSSTHRTVTLTRREIAWMGVLRTRGPTKRNTKRR